MNYWLVKSEPDVFSFQQLIKDQRTVWDGVRNYQARNNLRLMKMGDLVLFYHSNIGLEVVGIAKVSKEHFPDISAEKGDWSAVELQPVKPLTNSVPLAVIKKDDELKNILLVRNGRISVMPLDEKEFMHILKLSETSL